MRCSCCNRPLNDFESTLRHTDTGEFLDTCMECMDGLDIPHIGRDDLNMFDYAPDEAEYFGDEENE